MRSGARSAVRCPRDRRAALRAALLWAALPALAVLTAAVGLGLVVGASVAELARDVTVTAGVPLYTGALSTVTVMVWTAGAAVALTSAVPLRASGQPLAQLLLGLGAFTLVLAVDDQFLLHDGAIERVGVPGQALLVAYGVVVIALALRFRLLLRDRAETVVLLVGGALLAGSVGVDVLAEAVTLPEQPRILVEDGLKLVGAAIWTSGLVLLARAVCPPALPAAGGRPG